MDLSELEPCPNWHDFKSFKYAIKYLVQYFDLWLFRSLGCNEMNDNKLCY